MARGSQKAFVLITTGMSNKRQESLRTVGGVTSLCCTVKGQKEQSEGSLQA